MYFPHHTFILQCLYSDRIEGGHFRAGVINWVAPPHQQLHMRGVCQQARVLYPHPSQDVKFQFHCMTGRVQMTREGECTHVFANVWGCAGFF